MIRSREGNLFATGDSGSAAQSSQAVGAGQKKNVFVVGFDDYHEVMLGPVAEAREIAVHPLVRTDDLRGVEDFAIEALLSRARRELRAFDGSIDAIVTFLDFPAIEMTSVLARDFGVRAPSLESVLKCNHKYWSRKLQAEVAPRNVPAFAAFDPYEEDPLADLDLSLPIWVKPFNAFKSHLGFRINTPADFARALPLLRESVPRLAEPLGYLMSQAELPDEIAELPVHFCLAEELISGRQCTLEGYVYRGEPHIYGIVDSIRGRNRSSFARYQYPSRLPKRVQRSMRESVSRVLRHMNFDGGPFNAEMFYDRTRNKLWLLEINPRISQSHCELFEKVDGQSHHSVTIDLAFDREPALMFRRGRHNCAGKFFVRSYEDARVASVPGAAQLDRLAREMPDVTVKIHVQEGMDLSQLSEQDSYSFELAWIWLGGRNDADLLDKYNRCLEILGFELEDRRRVRWKGVENRDRPAARA